IAPGETGFLVPPGDVEAVAGAMLRVLRSPDVAHRMASAARRRVESEFTIEAMVAKTAAVYETCLSQAGLAGRGAVAAAGRDAHRLRDSGLPPACLAAVRRQRDDRGAGGGSRGGRAAALSGSRRRRAPRN